ncbi:rCG22920 [Rattus norvegicus]|uniref:RCG22920 n=1 Tax=Rattus norvegicus TaxID=10116 RepID=A6KB57_RAT|nr:rCG22920 [Rattus norvegicus]
MCLVPKSNRICVFIFKVCINALAKIQTLNKVIGTWRCPLTCPVGQGD